MSKLVTKWIADDAVDKDKINADVAGDGLTQAAGGELDVNVDDVTLETDTDVVQVKDAGIDTAQLAATSVTAAKLGSDVAGDGLQGGNGADLDVKPDAVGGANLARSINVDPTNGVGVKVDDYTIEEDGSQRLQVKGNSIGAAQIDETDNYTWSGSNDFTGASITVPAPSGDSDPVTKLYADALRAGAKPKDPVRAMSDSNLAVTGDPGTVDGVGSWVTDQRILLTNQSSPSEEGIWEVNTTGAWSRPLDYDTGDSAAGSQIWVNTGTTYGDSQWTASGDPPNDVIDTHDPAFVQTSGAGQVTAGVGLTKDGNTLRVGDGTTGDLKGINRTADELAVAVDGTTLEVDTGVSEQVRIKDGGVGTAKIAADAVDKTKINVDVAGDGVAQAAGGELDVKPDTVGGPNLATAINVDAANGVGVKVDDATIEEGVSGQLRVKDAGVDENKLNTSVAGVGISGGGGSALDLDIPSLTAETSADNADLLAIYDDSGTAHRKMTRANFLDGMSGEMCKQEMHKITSGENTAGYFTLAETPVNVGCVLGWPTGGKLQINKDTVGATGATPDFQILNNNQFHFNNSGAATGLSEDFETDDIVIVVYEY